MATRQLSQGARKLSQQKDQPNSFPCRECQELFTEESGASEGYLCESCEGQLWQNIENFKEYKNEIIEKDQEIQGDPRFLKWILSQCNKVDTHDSYIEFGHINDPYIEFLKGTFNGTSESFPETIQLELGEITLEQYNNSPNIRESKGLDQ